VNLLLISLIIIGSASIWPINRWVMDHRGHPGLYGFWMSLTGAVCAGLLVLVMGQPLRNPALWAVASVTGVAYGLGFCLLVPYCLRIGPIGPTCAVNNMGLVWPVLFGLFWPERVPFRSAAIAGLVLVVASFILFGLSKTSVGAERKQISRRWLVLVLMVWVCAGVSMTSQYVGARLPLTRQSPVAFVFCFSITASLVLLPVAARCGRAWLRSVEAAGGVANGIILTGTAVLVMVVLRNVRPEVFFPFAVAGPVLLVLLLGQVVYKERLDRAAGMGCLLAIAGLLALSVV